MDCGIGTQRHRIRSLRADDGGLVALRLPWRRGPGGVMEGVVVYRVFRPPVRDAVAVWVCAVKHKRSCRVGAAACCVSLRHPHNIAALEGETGGWEQFE